MMVLNSANLHDGVSYVYVLSDRGGKVTYVGQSRSVLRRIKSHIEDPQRRHFHRCEIWRVGDADLDEMEKAFIFLLMPALNRDRPFPRSRDAVQYAARSLGICPVLAVRHWRLRRRLMWQERLDLFVKNATDEDCRIIVSLLEAEHI